MKNEFEVSIVLPSYREEENLRFLLPRLRAVMNSLSATYEIIVVDSREPIDNTQAVCREFNVRYFNRQGGNFYGDAVRTGIDLAKGQYILFMDADGSHTPEFIPSLFQEREKNDVVIASRYVKGGHTENSKSLILMSWILNVSYALILNIKAKDVSNSFKLYRASMLKELALTCSHFDIIEEILFKLRVINRSLRIKEVPFIFKKRMFGETKRNLLVFIMTYLFTIIRLRLSGFSIIRKNQFKRDLVKVEQK